MAKTMYCTRCGHTGPIKRNTPGSFWLELALWLFFLLPGIVYSIFRLTSRYNGCAECGSEDVIPLSSPRARQMTEPLADPTASAAFFALD